jgi:aspartyl-tRNA(Asn)/glutamyl-tRNA(Gln) amidotransferase subunit A
VRLGPLDGIPLSIKDNLFVRGLRAAWGSRLYESFVPEQDDIWVERLRAAVAADLVGARVGEFA